MLPPRVKMPADPPLLLIAALFIAAAAGWLFGRYRSGTRPSNPPNQLSEEYFRGLGFLLDEEPDKALEVFLRMVDVELTGTYRQPTSEEILRTSGNPQSGICKVADGSVAIY